jgi:hypothetical protein
MIPQSTKLIINQIMIVRRIAAIHSSSEFVTRSRSFLKTNFVIPIIIPAHSIENNME